MGSGDVGSEPDRVRELPLVLDPVDVEAADANAIRGQAEPDAAPRQLVLCEEPVERPCERGDVAHLAADDDAGRERAARHLGEAGGAVVDDPRRGELGGTHLQADEGALGGLALLGA